MISIKDLLYDIDLKLNKVGSNEHQNVELENKLIALNDAQISIIKTKFSENNLFKLGLDSFQKRYNDLESLVVSEKFLPLTKSPSGKLNRWQASLRLLDPKYMLGIPGTEYILADKDDCKDRVLTVNLSKHGDVQLLLNNTNTNPSFEYQETIGTLSNGLYEVYTDGSFTPKKLYLSYIRYPKEVDFPGYTHFNGQASTEVDSELPYYLKEEIVDIAVRNLAIATENVAAIQGSNLKLQNDE